MDFTSQIENVELSIKKLKALQEEAAKELKEARALNSTLSRQKEEQLDAVEKTSAELRATVHTIQTQQNVLNENQWLEQAEQKELLTLVREKKVTELLAKQTGFWEFCAGRLESLMTDLNVGLEGILEAPKDPAVILKELKAEHESTRAFGERAVTTRQAINFYEQNLRKICEAHIDGHQIQPALKQERFNICERYFHHRLIMSMWG